MAMVVFSGRARHAFMIVCDGWAGEEEGTVLIQSDADYCGVAAAMGWVACDCPDGASTDGTVDCKCGRKSTSMIEAAMAWIEEREGESFDQLDLYLNDW